MAAIFELNSKTGISGSGVTGIPSIGLGTWQSKPGEVADAVEHAIKVAGYRHIDGAWAYGNEEEVGRGVGKALRALGIPRSEIFITSKLWSTHHGRVEKCLDETLAKLNKGFSEDIDGKKLEDIDGKKIDYLDLYLVHWPVALKPDAKESFIPLRPDGTRDVDTDWKISQTWEGMEGVLKTGKVKAIGVSNFSQKVLEELLPTATVKPAVNQVELHLYNPQLKLVEYLQSKEVGIVVQAYSPLGSSNSPLLTDETATRIAKEHGLQTSDVLLGCLLAKGIVILPKSVTPARIESNYTGAIAAAKKLSKENLKELDGVAASGKQKRLIMPPWGVDLGFENWP